MHTIVTIETNISCFIAKISKKQICRNSSKMIQKMSEYLPHLITILWCYTVCEHSARMASRWRWNHDCLDSIWSRCTRNQAWRSSMRRRSNGCTIVASQPILPLASVEPPGESWGQGNLWVHLWNFETLLLYNLLLILIYWKMKENFLISWLKPWIYYKKFHWIHSFKYFRFS